MDRVFVGVDISKDTFCAAGLDGQGKECFSGSYSMDSGGFCKFLEIVTAHCPDLQKVLVGMESTGCYHINLFSFLTSKGFWAPIINPLLIANFAKRSLRKTKTDKKMPRRLPNFLWRTKNRFHIYLSRRICRISEIWREKGSRSRI